ncbi:polymer-forming cytoskeletal protein [Erwinia tracheiphila]|nr:polymer-forming cytoskeletal protein [Erwinia tracheiphila]UIA84453.1 polymer-forming cytoskeletal protein [Erwinia tracheiphila]UIA87132.1 polymer-forming cytoskeletal protein [Erwinia tracheiphila]UIA93034.1 polymer-forming cytoskeletal protein [Erwinia tracheiphila]UIA95491.1 polymer-forming cytoskeletal protein [Erwinia tracheiphila]
MFKRKNKIICEAQASRAVEPEAYSLTESDLTCHDGIEPTLVVPPHDVSDSTTIPETCTIKGDINAAGDIHINGSINGIINCEKTVFVQKNGRVDGEVYAERIDVSGELKGLCRSQTLAINALGRLNGTIECESLSVHPDGRFHGYSKPYEQSIKNTDTSTEGADAILSLRSDLYWREEQS